MRYIVDKIGTTYVIRDTSTPARACLRDGRGWIESYSEREATQRAAELNREELS